MNNLFAKQCHFVAGAADASGLPEATLPEVAFAGRSNVGKSSLINALTGRKALARTSHTPGRTQQLNFFNLADQLMLVDLPGHGYAKVSRRQVADWTRLVRGYLAGRVTLRRVMLLVDSRHGLKDSDEELLSLLDEAAVPCQVVLTKIDKMKSEPLAKMVESVHNALKSHPAAHPVLLLTSAAKKRGLDELREEMAQLAER